MTASAMMDAVNYVIPCNTNHHAMTFPFLILSRTSWANQMDWGEGGGGAVFEKGCFGVGRGAFYIRIYPRKGCVTAE